MVHSFSRLQAFPLAALAAFAFDVGSCGGATKKNVQAPNVASSTSANGTSVPAAASTVASSEAKTAAPPFDPPSIHALLSDPSLFGVVRAMQKKDWRGAADAMGIAFEGKKIAEQDLSRAHFLRGRLLVQAKDEDGALAEYALVAPSSPLHAWASVRRATILSKKSGPADDILALLDAVPDAAPFTTDRRMAHAEALAAKGDHAGAAKELAVERSGARWVDASIRYAEEVAFQGTSAASLALDAALGARKIRFALPSSSLVARATEAENKCKALLSPKDAAQLGAPTLAEETTEALAFLDASKPKDAKPILEGALSANKKLKGKEPWCKAELALARVLERLRDKNGASDVYQHVIDACNDEASHVTALYDGAKIAAAAKKYDVARARFAELEKDHPKHRLADDARLRGAQTAIDAGDVAKGEAMLGSLADDYPSGDLRTEALFRLALARMKNGDWAGAKPYLERSLAIAAHEDGYFFAGRTPYFLGRAEIELGEVDKGVARLEKLIVDEPLTFASAMAYARLASRGADEQKKVDDAIASAIAAEPAGALWDANRSELTSEGFARAVELARVDETDLARKELAAIGLTKDAEKDPDGQWIAAALFAAVDDAKASHNVARARVTEWQRHFPGGKWRAAWELAYPRPFAAMVKDASEKQGVPASTLWAVMREESAFDPEAVSPSNAYGLLQLIAPTAAAYAKGLALPSDAKSLAVPEVNIPIGAAYLKKLRDEFSTNPALAVPSYNAGEGATRRWMDPPLAPSFDLWAESIPYEETRKYTKRVLTSEYAYVALYDAPHLPQELKNAAGK